MGKGERFGRFKSKAARLRTAYEDFMERQGFYIVLALCVLTILLTAVFTNLNPKPQSDPTPPPGLAAAADDPSVQRLAQAATPTPSPTQAPPQFVFPLANEQAVYRAFDGARPAYFEASKLWQLHPAVDIRAQYGQSVLAVADGTVQEIIENTGDSVILVLTHAAGYESRFRGLVGVTVRVGDTVRAGQAVGSAGYGPLIEKEDGAHVHLEILKDGIYMDPANLF